MTSFVGRHRAAAAAAVVAAVALCVGALTTRWFFPRVERIVERPAVSEAKKEEAPKIKWWTCSMHPQVRQPGPGICPLCPMELFPVYEGGGKPISLRQFQTTAAGAALMDIRTAPVERRFVTAEVRLVGKVDYDETKLGYITAWVPGRIDRLYVDYTGITVNRGEHMVYLYSPALLSAQEELIQSSKALRETRDSDLPSMVESAKGTVDAAREKLRLMGLTPEQVSEVEKRGVASDHLTIYAPLGGIVIHKSALEGMYVQTGTRIYTIADLTQVWVHMDAYESDLVWIRYGQDVEFTAESYPGEAFTGKIAFIAPFLDEKTRTVKVRVNVPNPDFRLKPGMFVRAVARSNVAQGGRVMDPDLAGKWICSMHPEIVKDDPGRCDICDMPLVRTESLGYLPVSEKDSGRPLAIPATAPLITGRRAVVYVAVPDAPDPTFVGQEIVLGPRAGNWYIVKEGLAEGQRVVTNGNFKIDSALQIDARPSMMSPDAGIATEPFADVPPAFREKLAPVLDAADSVQDAVETGQLDRARAAFSSVDGALKSLRVEGLPRDILLTWNELRTRLANDALVGSEAVDMKQARRNAAMLRSHAGRIRDLFTAKPDVKRPGRVETPEAFRRQIAGLFKSYLDVQKALAADDWESAKRDAEGMRSALQSVDMRLLRGDAHMRWMKSLDNLSRLVDHLAGEDRLDAQRKTFALLSEELSATLRLFGIAGMKAYEIHCPMAFNNRGADWLQADDDVRNPYFGKSMLNCGDVTRIIGEENEAQ